MGSVQTYGFHLGAERYTARLTQIIRDLLCWSVDRDPADRPGSRRRVSRPLRRLAGLAPGARGRAGVLADRLQTKGRKNTSAFSLSLVAFTDTFVDERSEMSLIALLDL
jgi:hypothetical protein